jgi:PAS domain S-box-containing protein
MIAPEPGAAGAIRWDGLPTRVAFWDGEMRNRLACAAFAAFAGSTPEEMVGRHAAELIGSELYELNRPYAERALAGERQFFERSFTDANGIGRRFQVQLIPSVVDGVRGFFAIASDITTDREDARELTAAEAVYRRAFMGSPVGKATFEDGGRILEVNPALSGMLRCADGAELVGTALVDLVDPALRDDQLARVRRLFDGELESATTELPVVRRDGSTLWVILGIALAEGGPHDAPLGIAQLQDISARKAIEDELRASRERLNEAEQIAQIGSWELDVVARRTVWSAGTYRIYGLVPAETDHDLDSGLRARVHPDDLEHTTGLLARALSELEPFDAEYRIVRGDGRIRTLRSRGEVIVGEDGNPVRIVGIVQDVTDAKRAHDALQRAGVDMEHRARELQQLALATAGRAEGGPHAALTPRQLEIVRLVAQGLTNGAIATRLFLSEATVKWHLKQILAKTGAANRAEAVARVLGAAARPPSQPGA